MTDPRPYRVLFVCTGNICRSAYADVMARALALPGVAFSSAGTYALVGHGMDAPMAALVGDRGDAAAHRARQLTRGMVERADLVVAMAAGHRRYILDEWPAHAGRVFVIGHVTRELASLPEEVTLDDLARYLWQHRSTAADDDVADPYRRGPEAAARAARILDGHLDALAQALATLVARRAGR